MIAIATLIIAGAKEPVTVSIGNWLVAERTKTGWTQPRRSLSGVSVNVKNLVPGTGAAKASGKIVIPEEESAQESDWIETGSELDSKSLWISGGRASSLAFKRLAVTNATYAKVAADYAKKKGSKAQKIVVQDVAESDLNGDGNKDIVLSFASAYDGDRPTKGYFSAVIVRSLVGGKVRTTELLWETNVGQMRGPWSSTFVGAGDFDGDKKPEFVVKTQDSWLMVSRIVQLSKSGNAKMLCATYFGD